MIHIARINEIRRGEYDEAYAIVRSMKSQSDWIIQEPLLAPSTDLFRKYLTIKNNKQWNQNTFETVYVPQFITELKQNPNAIAKLNEIYAKSKNGKNIALCCFCTDEKLCHRSIIGGLLQGVGADVRINGDYTHYYDIFKT